MSQGFYEQLGVPLDADGDQIRAAYGRAVAHLLRRREATVGQGGDPSGHDLSRAQLDEAWQVLSDPARRRRYDAMLAIAGDGSPRGSLDDLWSRVAGAMVHPSVAAAARLVDTTTRLQLGPLPEPPRPPGARTSGATWEDEVTVTSRVQATLRDSFGARRPVLRVAAPMGEDTESRPSAGESRPSAGESRPSAGEGRPSAGEGRPSAGDARGTDPRGADPKVATIQIHGRAAGAHAAVAGVDVAAGEAKVAEARPARPAAVQVEIKSAPLSEPQRLFLVHGPSGELLKAVREARGMSLQHVAEATRISVRYLDAIEREDYAALPSAAAFVRGYVREMARLLDLDVERIVEGYMRRFSGDG